MLDISNFTKVTQNGRTSFIGFATVTEILENVKIPYFHSEDHIGFIRPLQFHRFKALADEIYQSNFVPPYLTLGALPKYSFIDLSDDTRESAVMELKCLTEIYHIEALKYLRETKPFEFENRIKNIKYPLLINILTENEMMKIFIDRYNKDTPIISVDIAQHRIKTESNERFITDMMADNVTERVYQTEMWNDMRKDYADKTSKVITKVAFSESIRWLIVHLLKLDVDFTPEYQLQIEQEVENVLITCWREIFKFYDVGFNDADYNIKHTLISAQFNRLIETLFKNNGVEDLSKNLVEFLSKCQFKKEHFHKDNIIWNYIEKVAYFRGVNNN